MKTTAKFTALVAASLMAMASLAHAAGANGSNSSENGCAVGNEAPLGANCAP